MSFYSTVINVQDSQFRVECPAAPVLDPLPDNRDGLTYGEANWITVVTGVDSGPVNLTVETQEQPPAEVENGWEMVVERTIETPDETLDFANLYSEESAVSVETPHSLYKIRFHVKGRLRESDVHESHKVVLWPAQESTESKILHGPDDLAKVL